MASFRESFDRYRCVVFSVLSSLVFLAGSLAFSARPLSWGFLASFLMLSGVSALYFFLGRCSHLPQRTRYLVRVVPVLFLVVLIGGLVLAGFVLYLVHAQHPLRLSSHGSAGDIPRLFVLSLLVLGLLLPFFAVLAARDVLRVLRARHRVGLRAVTFFAGKREWVVRTDEYVALVLGENVVLACHDEEEVARAVDFVNRPLTQPLLARPLDGVHYVGTMRLAADMREKGFAVREARLALVARLS